nr:hypothetical protein [Stenotrophomonas pavanii]
MATAQDDASDGIDIIDVASGGDRITLLLKSGLFLDRFFVCPVDRLDFSAHSTGHICPLRLVTHHGATINHLNDHISVGSKLSSFIALLRSINQ